MATYPDDAVGSFTTDGFSSMADRKPDRGYTSSTNYNTIQFVSEAGYEKRRLRNRRSKRSLNLTYTNVSGLQKEAIESFFRERSGTFESFYMDLSHVNETGIMTVRFDSDVTVNQVHSSGANVLENYYTISFKLMEVFD